MTIKDVEKKLNVSRANIRFYEKEGLLDPKRNNNEYRNYSVDDVKKLEQILLFRKCNVSIEDIRLIFNGTKSLSEVFSEQISVIENEIKQLEGAKIMCKKLAQEINSVNNIDTKKYIDIMNNEEQKGNKFYNITEDYLFATEKLYQYIIENKKFGDDEKMKKRIKIGIYIGSFVVSVLLFGLFDYFFNKSINWEDAICFTAILTIVDLIGVKQYIEKQNKKKFTKKDNINHFIIIVTMMVVSLLGYLTIKSIYEVYKEPNNVVLEMSVKKTLIDIAHEKYVLNDNNIYAESHKIIDYDVKDNEIYVYIVANYGIFTKNDCKVVNDTKNYLTIVYNKNKSSNGIYELKKYEENSIPNDLKNKTNVDYDDTYFKSQVYNYCNK